MAVPTSLGITFLLSLAIWYLFKRAVRPKIHALPLPPGPKGIPLLGNVNDLPKPGVPEFEHWLKHKDLYGPISSITVLGQTFIIIHDSRIALQLLKDRSAVYSGRPSMVFSSEMIGWKNTLAGSGYTDTFRLHRKNFTKVTSSSAVVSVFDRVQEEETAHFLLNVLASPENLEDHIKKEAGAVILKITYGYTVEAHGRDPLVDLAGQTMHDFADAAVPGRWAVDMFPFLRYAPDWLPGTGFKETARRMAAQLNKTTEQPYQFVKKQIREKKHNVSFLSQALKLGSDANADMEQIHKWSASSMYLGGADTTVSSLMTFFLAMMVFPEVQEKAREELDRVIGSDRLPVTADRPRLPYIEAIMKETHRWHPVGPMGLPHATDKDDEVDGYRIPKGALVMTNTWWFTHDPSVYPSPMTFLPERHLDTPTHKAEPDPRTWIFGYGRRVCPGRYVADNAVFLTIAQTLAVFHIAKPVENGRVIEPEVKFEAGLVSHPVPYRASVTPRSPAHEELIRKAETVYPWQESDAKELDSIVV